MIEGSGSGTGISLAVWLLANLACYAANESTWLSRVLRLPPLLCVSNRVKFADPQPETFWVFDLLDARDLAKSYWIGSRGLLFLRLCVAAYFAGTLSANGLTAHGFQDAQWMVYFTNWSFCLTLLSATLGVAVSVRYLILSHHFKHTVVHGRPGLTPQHRSSQHTCASFGVSNILPTTDDPEEGLMPPHTAEASTSQSHDSYVQPGWALQAPEQASSSEIQISSGVQPSRPLSSSAQPAEAAFAKAHGHTRTPSDLDSLAPAELRYAPQLTQWSCLEKLHCLMLQTAAVTSTLVLVFYWAFVVDSSQDVLPDDYLQHAASAPIMLLDVWFSKVPFVSYHLQVMILYGSLYELFMWIYYGVAQHWMYDVLSWDVDKSVAVYVLLPIAFVLLFYIWFLVVLLRNYLGDVCGSHILCPRCYQQHSHQAKVQAQRPDTPISPTRHLKKQSSGVPVGWSGSTMPGLAPLDIIAADTRYSGQQVSASGRTVLSPMGASPDNLFMELSRRGSAPK